MGLTFDLAWLETVMLASVRVAGFLVIAPPFAHRGVPGQVKAMLAVALGLVMAARVGAPGADAALPSTSDTGAFVVALVLQVVVGTGLGFLVALIFAAVQAAGSLIDLFGGFQLAQAFDPMTNANTGPFGKLYQLAAIVLLFASDGYQLVLGGLARSFDAVPLDAGLRLAGFADTLTHDFTQMFLAAMQVAGPLIVVLFLADVGLGLLTRVAPALNAFALGFPLKILITLTLVVFAFVALPQLVSSLAGRATNGVLEVVSG